MKDDSMIYLYSEKEKEDKLESLTNMKTIARCKGLGELDATTMSETAMDPETRNLVRVTVDDAKEMTNSLDDWMGTDHTNRRDFISENLYKYVEAID